MKSVELFHLGQETHAYRYFGAHALDTGYRFRLWVPDVTAVFVVGDFNGWQNHSHPMTEVSPAIYECNIPDAQAGQCYKFAVQEKSGNLVYRADPFSFQAELRPNNASVLYTNEHYPWNDHNFLEKRPTRNEAQAINIYEVHLGSWRKHEHGDFLNYDEIGDELIPYLLEMHYTHVEFMPIQEHPLDASWGYQVTGYFAVTSRFGEPRQFKNLVNRLHQAGIGVILDWVPAHFPKDEHGLARFNGSALYEYADESMSERKIWGTLVFDYNRPEVCSFLLSNAFFWVEEFHIDGLRFDAVSSILYRDYDRAGYNNAAYNSLIESDQTNTEAAAFISMVNAKLHAAHPQCLTFAEESSDYDGVTRSVEEGGLGFDYKWNMGWMHDTLSYFKSDYVHRPYQHQHMTFSLTYAFKERHLLPFSHDEVVHGKRSLIDKMPGDYWRKFASYRSLLAYMMTHPGAKLLFMGSEFAQFTEWHYYESLDWYLLDYEMHRKLQSYVTFLNKLYKDNPALWANDEDWSGFAWVDADDAERTVFSYLRSAPGEAPLLIVLNMLPSPIEDFSIGVPFSGRYEIVLNSDKAAFGGSDYPVLGDAHEVSELETRGEPDGDLPDSLAFRLTPLSCMIFKYKP